MGDEQVRLLMESRNRAILDLLDEAEGPLRVTELADRLVSRDVDIVSTEAYENRVDQARLSLHHSWLPRLDEHGLVEYDPDAGLVTAHPPTAPDIDWQGDELIEALATHAPTSTTNDTGEMGVLDGRESIVQYGRQLADEAEEELFCMFVSTHLLEEECIRRAKNALDRGVTAYIGSQNAEVRHLARRHLSETTIWEPQLDWLNTRSYPRVGRLVLVDRRKVMLAVLDEPPADAPAPDETALVGVGETNPLVVLVRELLGTRLDHLDYQSDESQDDFLSA